MFVDEVSKAEKKEQVKRSKKLKKSAMQKLFQAEEDELDNAEIYQLVVDIYRNSTQARKAVD